MTRYVIVDIETTGLDPERDRVVWFAAVVLSHGSFVERWSTLVDPGPGARTRAGGLDLQGQPTFADIASPLTELLRGGVLVAHNAPFDVRFLTAEYKRSRRTMYDVPIICTMQLARRLELKVASFSLVDCCAHFGIPHRRRHRADEDAEAAARLFNEMLPLTSARGWDTPDALIEALKPADSCDDPLSFTIEFNLEEIFAQWLVEEAGWRPGEESPEEAMRRHSADRRVEREVAYARMAPEHRAAHQMKDALRLDETRASAWSPVLHALEEAKCPEAAKAWVEYARCIQGPKRNTKRALNALRRALDLYLSSPDATRATVDDTVTWIGVTCDEAQLPDELIEIYQTFGPRLAALPPCGECGDLTTGCLGGTACTRAVLAWDVVWSILDAETEAGVSDIELVERRVRAVFPILEMERDHTAYVGLGFEFGQRLVERGRYKHAVSAWLDIVDRCAGQDVPTFIDNADRLAVALATAKRYEEASVVGATATDAARQQAWPGLFWQTADHLGYYLERAGRLEEAIDLWREAIDAGSDRPNTFDRLSLALERGGQPGAAMQVCETGLARFPREMRRFKYVEQIARRAERCRAKTHSTRA